MPWPMVSSACIRRAPSTPREAMWTWRIRSLSQTCRIDLVDGGRDRQAKKPDSATPTTRQAIWIGSPSWAITALGPSPRWPGPCFRGHRLFEQLVGAPGHGQLGVQLDDPAAGGHQFG